MGRPVEEEELLTGQHAAAVIAAEPTEVRWLERVVARHRDYRVVLAATPQDLAAGVPPVHGAHGLGSLGRLRLALLIASLGSLGRSNLAALAQWQTTLNPTHGIVAITPPCAILGTCALAALGVRHHLIAPVTERVLLDRLDRSVRLDAHATATPRVQREVDLVLQAARAMVPRNQAPLPKGFSARTRDVIVRELERLGAATAQQVADATGLSRVSVRRYLELLESQGTCATSHAYGGRGRPATVYELTPLRSLVTATVG